MSVVFDCEHILHQQVEIACNPEHKFAGGRLLKPFDAADRADAEPGCVRKVFLYQSPLFPYIL